MTITLTELRPREEAYRVKTENITIQAEGPQQRDVTVIGGAAGVGLSAAKREPLSVQRLGVEPVRPPS